MRDVVLGLVAIGAGALFCFAGHLAFRVVIPIWGAFVGFGLGAGLVAGIGGDGFLSTALGWGVGAVVGLLFALVAYLFYEVAIVLATASIGFSLGVSLMVALDVSWQWVIVLAGVALGTLLALAAIALDLPMVLLVVLSAAGGASAVVTGVMLLVGAIDAADFDDDPTKAADNDWWWYVLYGALVVAGIVVQLRAGARLRGSTRDAWAERRAA